MKRIPRPLAAAPLLALVLAACSSAPKPPAAVFDRRNEAASLAALGARMVRDGAYMEAARLYGESYRIATSVADDEGRLIALDGLAGSYARIGSAPSSAVPAAAPTAAAAQSPAAPSADRASAPGAWGAAPESSAACIALAASVAAASGRADLAAFASLSAAEALLGSAAESDLRRAADTAAAAAAALEKRPADRARALRILGEARKGLSDGAGALSALDAAADIDRRARRFASYAAARFLAASVHSKAGAYEAARAALLDALDADRRAENPAGIGADYRALGQVAEKAGDKTAAAAHYAAARDVFAAARFEGEAADAERRRAALD